MRKHARVVDIKARLGAAAADYTFVGFIRDPREVVVSKYYWYRNGWPAERLREGRISSLRRRRRRWYLPNQPRRPRLARPAAARDRLGAGLPAKARGAFSV